MRQYTQRPQNESPRKQRVFGLEAFAVTIDPKYITYRSGSLLRVLACGLQSVYPSNLELREEPDGSITLYNPANQDVVATFHTVQSE